MFARSCSGLAATGSGMTTVWRLIFVVRPLIGWLPLIVYLGIAVALPEVSSDEEAKRKGQIADGGDAPLPRGRGSQV